MKDKIKLIPQVKKLTPKKGAFLLADQNTIYIISKTNALFDQAKILKEALNIELNIQFQIVPTLKPQLGINIICDESKEDESYQLKINKDQVIIKSKGSAGCLWGIQTLKQIVKQYKTKLPCLDIEDAPQFPNRGFYHDITRGKVPTLETMKELVVRMSAYKMNELQLYVEHTFAFKAFPELWADKSPLTAEEILELDQFCKIYHIDLVPSLTSFGHFYELIRLKKYEHLNELDIKASEVPYSLRHRMANYTLDVSQKESFEVVKTLIEEYLPLFTSKRFNVCCDETFDLGKGKNKKKADKVGSTRLYVDFLKKILTLVTKHNKTPMFWGDIVLHDPSVIKEIPKDMIFLNWMYHSNPSESKPKIFAKEKVTQYLCPGTSGWNNIMNNIDIACANIGNMADLARKYKAIGILNTDWGDYAHINLLGNSMHGMIFGADCSWSAKNPTNSDFDRSISFLEWQDDSGKTATLIRKLGSVNSYHFRHLYYWSCGLKNHEEDIIRDFDFTKKISANQLVKKHLMAQNIKEELQKLSANNSTTQKLDYQEFIWSAEMTSWLQAFLLYRKKQELKESGIKLIYNKDELIKKGYAILEEIQNLWNKRNKTSELQVVIKTFKDTFHKIECLK
ncbi:MAG: glycosyl hydrolase family 20 [Planctomycetota bacterium]|nr:MAG: glycosyl hydrolase family 20 [Planctomycetota bacterium]